jgi:hypothetical protein
MSMEKVISVLKYRKKFELAELLKGSSYELEASSTYGSRLFSQLTTAQIYCPIDRYERLKQLPKEDLESIISAFHVVHPVKDYELEIDSVEFFINPDLPIPVTSRETSRLKQIDFTYITEQIAKCDDKIQAGDFEGAITNARNLVESICKYILDKTNQPYKETDDLPNLYRKTVDILNMHPSAWEHKPFKQVLSGCFAIVDGLANIRNILSDAHGKSQKSLYKPMERHAVLAVSAAKLISDYLYSSYIDKGLDSTQ